MDCKQETKYPFDNKIQIAGVRVAAQGIYGLCPDPAWATPDPVLSVNGKRVSDPVQPGTFASIRRTWKDGDRVELELPMPTAAGNCGCRIIRTWWPWLQGPLVLFAIADSQPSFDRNGLLQAKPDKQCHRGLDSRLQPTEAASPCVRL